ncbi:MAG: type II toxin-antitoxin system Phd/YefM family antitoxin [Bacillota bacterium]|nr:type II toxin-antitoxin system Phd/YefM family antitoxin [Bacillota bacterium]
MPALKLDRKQMVSSTEMARRFAEYLDRTQTSLERFFITRNNEIEAVLLSVEDYERLVEFEEIVEHLVIAKMIEERQDEPEVIDLEALLREEGLDPDDLRRIDPE